MAVQKHKAAREVYDTRAGVDVHPFLRSSDALVDVRQRKCRNTPGLMSIRNFSEAPPDLVVASALSLHR